MELPLLEPVYQKYKDQGFELVAIDVRADTKGAMQFRDEKKLSFTMLEGNVPMAVNEWKIQYTPSSFLINKMGKIEAFHGVIPEEKIPELEKQISDLLAQ